MTKHLAMLLVGMMAAATAHAQKASDRKMASRAEAQDLVDDILAGRGNLNALISRAQYLGEEGTVCLELAETARRSGYPEQQRRIAQAIATLAHPNGENALINLLQSDDGAVRMTAAQGLGRMKSQLAAPKLVPLLTDKTLGVRKEAAKALGLIHYTRAGPALLKAAKAEGEIEVRAEMLIAVGGSGDKRQAPALEAYLSDSSESARFAAAQGLCLLGHKSGFEVAKKRLQSADRYERLEGLKLFEGTKGKEAGAVLTPLLQDKDKGIAATAARILYQGGDPKMLDWLVLKSFESNGEEKLAYERELETLRLADDQRRAILAKAGIK